MKNIFIPWAALLFTWTTGIAQPLEVIDATTPPFDPVNLISSVFLGNGVEVTGITFKGEPVAVGYFTGGASSVGIDRGIVLTTGRATTNVFDIGCNQVGSDQASVSNGSNATDPDLAFQVPGATIRDVAMYEIKFVPTADTLRFSYVFASEEYPEFACSEFNDVFGFFIQGPGYPAPTNIARIPGTGLPVTINNLHPDNSQPGLPCPPVNEIFYNDNNVSNKQPTYDGYTDVFVAEAVVTPCAEYTIKLAIADVTDMIYDSGVFLEAKSFGTGSLQGEVVTASLDGVVAEGCAKGYLTFTLPNAPLLPYPVDYNVFGTAINGVDYDSIPVDLVLGIGQQSITIPISAREDSLSEGTEFIGIDVQRDPCNRDTFYFYLRDNGLLPPQLPPDTTLCSPAQPILLDGTAPVPLPAPPSFTQDADLPIDPTNTPVFSSLNVFGVQPPELGQGVLRSVCLNIAHTWLDDLDIYLISPGGQFVELSTDNGLNGDNFANTCFSPNAVTPIDDPGGTAPFTGDWLPEGPFSDLWNGPANGVWQLRLLDDSNGFTGALNDWTITFEPLYDIQYQWTPASGLSCADCPVTVATPVATTVYTVRATDTYGCEVFDSIRIEVLDSLPAPEIGCFQPALDSVTFVWAPITDAGGYEVNVNGSGWTSIGTDTFFVVNGLQVPFTQTQIAVRATGGPAACPASIGTAVCLNCPAPAAQVSVDSVRCFGERSGAVALTVSGGSAPYTFALDTFVNFSGLFGSLGAGNYSYTVTDATGCPISGKAAVEEPPVLTTYIDSLSGILCFGQTTGILQAIAAGGNGQLGYKWNNGRTQVLLNNLPAGAYQVTVTDHKGCSNTDSLTLLQPDELLIATSANQIICPGESTGSASAQANGGTTPVQYAWSNGVKGPGIDNVPKGVYRVTATDANGCTAVDSVQIEGPDSLKINIVTTPATCSLDNDGSATASVTGGTPPYGYLWSDPAGQTTSAATNLEAGSYFVTVTDANGCEALGIAVVAEPPPLLLLLDPTDIGCNGATNGAVNSSISGGISPYTYLWSTGATGTKIDSLGEGSYSLTVTDAKGCTIGATVFIHGIDTVHVTPVVQQVACFGEATGSIALDIVGGSTLLTVDWIGPLGPLTGRQIEQLPAGDYTYTVQDTTNCPLTAVVTVLQPAAPLSATVAGSGDTLCFASHTGILTAIPGGGTAPYAYLWPGGSSDSTRNGLSAGAYSLTLTDNNGCTSIAASVLFEKEKINLQLSATNARCHNRADGSAQVASVSYDNAVSDPGLFTYTWNATPLQTTLKAIGLQGGRFYRVTATDSDGCFAVDSIFVDEPEPLGVTVLENRAVSCAGGADGSIVVQGNGGMGPYTYQWSPATGVQNDSLYAGLKAGKYRMTVTDQEGCIGMETILVSEPLPLDIQFSVTAVACFGESSGAISSIVQGGTPGYNLLWVNGSTQTDVQNLPAGWYSLQVTDGNGCLLTDSVFVEQPKDSLQGSAVGIPPSCFGGSDCRIILKASGGTPPYRYALNDKPFNGSSVQIGLTAGVYTPVILDKNGCQTRLPELTIDQPDPLLVQLGPDFTIAFGQDTQLAAIVFNNQGPVEFAWANAGAPWLSCLDCADPFVAGLDYDRYFEVSAVDSAGCRAEDRIRIAVLKSRKVFVPTGFSPNADGNNDRLLVHGDEQTQVLQFSVYNRWGELVFEDRDFFLNDPGRGWDGQFRGQPCDPGVFVWVLEVAFEDGYQEVLKGNTTLVR